MDYVHSQPVALFVIGTRPEAIKLAPLIYELKKPDSTIRPVIVSTGQHRSMLLETLSVLGCDVDYDLAIMRPRQTLEHITTEVIQALPKIFKATIPRAVIVQGDTTSAFAAALSAFYNNIPLYHVEAGLRTGNLKAPYPEEANRALIARVANLHFAPTEKAKHNLLAENINPELIHVTGNTIIDAFKLFASLPVPEFNSALKKVLHSGKKIVLVTCHRRETTGLAQRRIARALAELADSHKHVEIIFPLHKNPAVRENFCSELKNCSRVHLIDPLPYHQLVHVIKSSYLILTDSGGIQEEACACGVPTGILREETERTEGIKAGVACRLGTDPHQIISWCESLLKSPEKYARYNKSSNCYGDGLAAKRIISIILQQPEFNPASETEIVLTDYRFDLPQYRAGQEDHRKEQESNEVQAETSDRLISH
ncbi:MAG: UDP-N-acetylglucosamine 2-epimerase (non-hydrolyzing) [Candidatus Dadabacteria bacterium]|nr:MAG: UDP-N-acetylglucosamine 2-epimerase (non-hydrolyzing) [Candidatus Dadabacteria bacterium]